ncbi:MAG: BPSS1780 family membrane protein [Sphingomonadaceae bacterium]
MLEKLPARTGILWVRQGFNLFRQQPGALLALLFSSIFLSIAALIIPLLGPLMPTLLTPLFSVALLQACAEIDQGRRPLPGLIFVGFRKPARAPLMLLGVLYIFVWLLALGVLSWMDDGVFVQMVMRQIPMDEKLLEGSRGAILTAVGIYLVMWLLTCLAAPLIYWQHQTIGKALFFSAYAVLRSFWAFIAGGVTLFALHQVGITIPVLLFDSVALEATAIFTVFFLLVILVHCMLYASYCRIFGQPPAPAVPAAAS